MNTIIPHLPFQISPCLITNYLSYSIKLYHRRYISTTFIVIIIKIDTSWLHKAFSVFKYKVDLLRIGSEARRAMPKLKRLLDRLIKLLNLYRRAKVYQLSPDISKASCSWISLIMGK